MQSIFQCSFMFIRLFISEVFHRCIDLEIYCNNYPMFKIIGVEPHINCFSTLSAANLPVKIAIGSPEGLNDHCPAWKTSGTGVNIDLATFESLFSTGIKLLVNAHPVIAPSNFLSSFPGLKV